METLKGLWNDFTGILGGAATTISLGFKGVGLAITGVVAAWVGSIWLPSIADSLSPGKWKNGLNSAGNWMGRMTGKLGNFIGNLFDHTVDAGSAIAAPGGAADQVTNHVNAALDPGLTRATVAPPTPANDPGLNRGQLRERTAQELSHPAEPPAPPQGQPANSQSAPRARAANRLSSAAPNYDRSAF